jgi:bifunctional UDP-N-acetylglucosamine pyrophosphorylase/glucosamine-1-phosphate N-acetyltransferase
MNEQIVILAAGKGARMNSPLPKPMHKVENQTMLDKVINASKQVTDQIILVHSHQMLPYLQGYSQYQLVLQEEQLGTAHAAFCALEKINKDSFVTLAYSDHPFIDSPIINKLFDNIIGSNYNYLTLASIQE